MIIPLRTKQVSKANLHSKQGGINFTPYVLSLPYAKKKKKKIKISHMDGGSSKMSVCCLSVCLSVVCLSVCHEFIPNYLLHRWSDRAKFFFTKTRENVYLRILILKLKVKTLGLRPQGRFWCQINFGLQFLSNRHKKYIFAKINLFSRALSRRNFDFLPQKILGLIQGKKYSIKNRVFQFQSQTFRVQKRPPSKSNFNGGDSSCIF